MHPRNITFFMMLFMSELFLCVTFSFIFEQDTFYMLLSYSAVACLVLGFIGFLKMQGEPQYTYREAYDHEAHRFDES